MVPASIDILSKRLKHLVYFLCPQPSLSEPFPSMGYNIFLAGIWETSGFSPLLPLIEIGIDQIAGNDYICIWTVKCVLNSISLR